MLLRRLVVPLAVLSLVCSVATAQITTTKPGAKSLKKPVLKPGSIRLKPNLTKLRIASPSASFQNVLKEKGVEAAKQRSALSKFNKLPKGLQMDIVQATDVAHAQAVYRPLEILPKQIVRIRDVLRLPFRITSIWPDDGSENNWAYVRGWQINDDCQVIFDGDPQTTYYLDFNVEFFPNSLAFVVPDVSTLAVEYPVTVRNTASNDVTGAYQYRIVAPRGYRGYHGWKFANFSDPQIPWHLYRDFFGADAVEYPDGTHRPAAQEWYDTRYHAIGNGGNCYGMSVSSIRAMRDEVTTYHDSWFAANDEDYVWKYPWNNTTKETVQEDQGGQLSAEMAGHIDHYFNHQDHREAWQRVHDLCNTANDYAIVGFTGPGWGHAVVGYDTQVDGDDHDIVMYDNNVPYEMDETGGPDRSISTVGWAANDFTYPGTNASRMICMSYSEALEGPTLPAAAGGTDMGTVIAVANRGAVSQITDAQGNSFFNADGSINDNPATRIPDSMKFIPFTGTTPVDFPDMFIFNNTRGKTLTFTLQGRGNKVLSVFQPGDVFRTQFTGTGQIRCNRLLTNERSLEVPAPNRLAPTSIRMIKVRNVDRVYQIDDFSQLPGTSLLIRPAVNGTSLDVETQGNLRFNMRLETFAAGAAQARQFANVQVDPNRRGTFAPTSWNNLRGSNLQLRLFNLGTNAPIRNLNIRGGR